MGNGSYSTEDRYGRATALGYYDKNVREIFTQATINDAMNPCNAILRESRDSIEHPESLAIIIALDVTGSMGSIPHYLVKDGLPILMDNLIQRGIKDPQVLFLAIGDHECDRSPLQVGQFESSDDLLDKWLTTVYLEGGGGGNDGESYFLSWYFAAKHTSIDCLEKRNRKGFLFSIGDEPTLKSIPARDIKKIMGVNQVDDKSDAVILLDGAKEKYEVFHLHLKQGSNGLREDVIAGWKQLLGDNLLIIDRKEDISKIIADKIISMYSSNITTKKEKTETKSDIIL